MCLFTECTAKSTKKQLNLNLAFDFDCSIALGHLSLLLKHILQLMDQPEYFLLSQCTSLGLHPGVHLVQRGLDEFIQRVGHDVGDGVVENTGDDSDEDVGHPVKQNVATESDVHVAARGSEREKK